MVSQLRRYAHVMGGCCCNWSDDQEDLKERLLSPSHPSLVTDPRTPPPPTLYGSASLRRHIDGHQYSRQSQTRGSQLSTHTGESYQPSSKRNAESCAKQKPPKGAPRKEPYYCGRLSTRKAEDQLNNTQKLDGTFIIRDCEVLSDRDHGFVLSVMREGEVYHLDINRGQNKKYTLGDVLSAKSFSSVAKLVNYYQSKPIDLPGGGSVKLQYYLPPQ